MARIQIKAGTRYVFRKQIHHVRQLLVDNCYRIENLSTGEESIVNYADILSAWSSGELRFEIGGPNAVQDRDVPLKTRYVDDDLEDLPESIREEAWRRYHLVLALYRYHQIEPVQLLTRRQIGTYVNSTGQQNVTSVSSMNRYMHSFVNSGGDIRSLVPQTRQRGGKDRNRLDEAVERILEAVLEKYASITERESTVDQVMTDVLNAIADENRFREPQDQLAPPSKRTVRRRIRAAGERRILGRKLSRREQKAQTETQPGPRPARVLERVEIDHTPSTCSWSMSEMGYLSVDPISLPALTSTRLWFPGGTSVLTKAVTKALCSACNMLSCPNQTTGSCMALSMTIRCMACSRNYALTTVEISKALT